MGQHLLHSLCCVTALSRFCHLLCVDPVPLRAGEWIWTGFLLFFYAMGTRSHGVPSHSRDDVSKRPWSFRGSRGYAPMGAHGWVCRLLYAVHQMLSLVPCTGTVSGAAGHNRWGVVERRLPAKTRGRTADCTLTPPKGGSEAAGAAEWLYHSRQAGTPRRATNPKTGGHRPEKRPLRQV